MNPLIQLKKAIPVFLVALSCFGLSPVAQAQLNPPPDGGYPNGNTAEGDFALFNLTGGTTGGTFNTAIGFEALFSNTTGDRNTAIGADALFSNTTTGDDNTATGVAALFSNTIGFGNTATGADALFGNTSGNFNTATGVFALSSNTSGFFNTANGVSALVNNTSGNNNTATGADALTANATGTQNTATGAGALFNNTTANNNTANGVKALYSNQFGERNTAIGVNALLNSTGNDNIALGHSAGENLTMGDNNIYIGAFGPSIEPESDTIRIGRRVGGVGVQKNAYMQGIFGATASGGVAVFVTANGKLGTMTSSARFKVEIKPMDKASEVIFALKPVTFRYKKELDPEGIPEFGLVAEEVEKVNSDLVARDAEGKPYTVRYEAVNAMLLNEFLKEHRKNEEQEKTIAQLKSGITTLAATVKEQAAEIQKVSARLEASKPAPQVVNNP
jgi:hypothetical protein